MVDSNKPNEPDTGDVLLNNPVADYFKGFYHRHIENTNMAQMASTVYHGFMGVLDSKGHPLDNAAQSVVLNKLTGASNAATAEGVGASNLATHMGADGKTADFWSFLEARIGNNSPILAAILLPIMDVVMNISKKIHLGEKVTDFFKTAAKGTMFEGLKGEDFMPHTHDFAFSM